MFYVLSLLVEKVQRSADTKIYVILGYIFYLIKKKNYFRTYVFYNIVNITLNDDYEYALKWKIYDTLGRLGSLEDTFILRRFMYTT